MTLEGLIYLASRSVYTGSFRLRMTSAPTDGESGITTGLRLTVACDGSAPDPVGEYSTSLRAGTYQVELPGTPAFEIVAPTGSGTYALEQLTTTAFSAVTQQIFDVWTEVDDATLSSVVQLVYVRQDIDGEKGTFWRATGTVTGIEGADFVRDLAGTYFERAE